MKTFLGALLLLCLIGAASVSAAAATALTGSHIKARVGLFKFRLDVAQDAYIKIVSQDRPLFLKSQTDLAYAACITTFTNDSPAPKGGGSTCTTNAAGTELVIKSGTQISSDNLWLTLKDTMIDANAVQGIYNIKMESYAADGGTCCGGATDAMADAFEVPLYSAADTFAVGSLVAADPLKSVSPGLFTFNFFIQESQTNTDIITFTASEAIFATGLTASKDYVSVLTESSTETSPTPEDMKGSDVATWSTVETTADGKTLKLNVKTALSADKKIVFTVTAGAMANNPSSAGLVTVTAVSTTTTVAVAQTLPIYNAALTPIYLGASVGTDEISVAPASLSVTFVPKGALGNALGNTPATIEITSSTAIFTAAGATTCAMGPSSSYLNTETCTASADADKKVLTVTVVAGTVTLLAGEPVTIQLSSNLANNAATAGAASNISLKTSVDTTASATADGAYLFKAALTAYFKSAGVDSLVGQGAPGNLTLKFVPQTTVAGAATKKTVAFTANAAIFEASGSFPSIVCSSVKNNFATTVPCTAAADADGKVLTVTATTDSNDFIASEIGQVVLKNHRVNPDATAVTFALTTAEDTASSGAQTGYTTTSAPTPTPTPTSGGNSTSTCTYSSASTCATRVTQSVVVSSLTAANYIGNLKKIYECGYAQVVRSDFCTTSLGVTTIKTGVQVTSTAAARRAATITFVMDVETGVMTTALLQTAIQDGVTATALVNKMTVIRTNTGWTAVTLPEVADLTVNTAAFTGAATSSAAVVIPSALMVLLGSFISLFWN